ncbi:hypothetical protein HK099_004409 [Clydaea vesicula]|uniref:HYDIN/VesB/CFA65-like Ig-like domain-containing protein n=1 Tax=Clydaea vesicula TaxID=447962 RepID=A0AAD5XYK8_9FUNG|nr:hypothetical protein HK099_004409 [Clydaea vesicula]
MEKNEIRSEEIESGESLSNMVHILRPSDYIKERGLNMFERMNQYALLPYKSKIVELALFESELAHKKFSVLIDTPIFEANPKQILLQAFEPFQTYDVTIVFRNNDNVPRRIKIEKIEHQQFSISGQNNNSLNSGRVAPGMDISFILSFRPEECCDYHYNLVCITDREKFLVPIKAIGARAVLDFPDEVSYTDCPVRYTTSKTLLVRNIGNKAAKYTLNVSPPFYPSPPNAYLENSDIMQVDIEFRPINTGSYTSEMILEYDTGEKNKIKLVGTAEDANIRLEMHTLRLSNTYITLTSTKTIKIHNRSDIMAKFEWKMFANDMEENQHRRQLQLELEKRDEEESTKLKLNKAREIENENYLFSDGTFSVEPIQGSIWPNSAVEITIVFQPTVSGSHTKTVFCEVSGRETRLPLILTVSMENLGDIDIHYSLSDSKSLFSSKFKFQPNKGILKVGEQSLHEITFCSDILGEFSEEFLLLMEGSADPLVFTAKGSVVGPTFNFDIPSLDFGNLAYGFLTTKTFNLINTSKIPMMFHLRIPEIDEGGTEFVITPVCGSIPAMGLQKIQVDFRPMLVGTYNSCLIVDVESVGQDMFRIDINAKSIVSEVLVKTPTLDFGGCYMNYPYHQFIELANETDLPVRYNLLNQDENAQTIYSYFSKNSSGVISPKSIHKIEVEFKVKRLGVVKFPIFIKIFGSEHPFVVDINGIGFGPNVVIMCNELNFGKIPVLKDVPMSIKLKNDSPIPAKLACSIVSEYSVFVVDPPDYCIPPGEEIDLVVTAFLDDCLKFTDILKISIHSDAVHEIQLVAKGQGSTITFDNKLLNVDFKDVFSNRECSKEFVLSNKGRRTQTIYWQSDDKQWFSAKDSTNNVFEVIPNRMTLKPGCHQIIHIKGFSDKAFTCKEVLMCQGTIDKDPTRKTILNCQVSANFINPLILVQPNLLKFISAHIQDVDLEVITQELKLTNTSPLPLHISFKCSQPYSVHFNESDSFLKPEGELRVIVQFDPSYNVSRLSSKEHSKLYISYSEHPQKEVVDLFSDMSFPNLTFSQNSMNFGCINRDTEHRKTFTMTNTSNLPCFVEGSVNALPYNSSNKEDMLDVPIAQVFDIIPLRGVLQPNEQELVEVSFYGHMGKFYVNALCDVSGGPKYELMLQGEASFMDFEFDKKILDFGTRLYQEIGEQDVLLTNTGFVSFEYTVSIPSWSSLMPKILISPSSGQILPGGKQKLIVKFCCCVPEMVEDYFYVQIAHFEAVKIRIFGNGTFPEISVDLPRLYNSRFDRVVSYLKSLGTSKVLGSNERISDSNESSCSALEFEADRIILKEKTLDLLVQIADDIKSKGGSIPKFKYIGSTILAQKHQQKISGSKDKRLQSISETSTVELTNFLCNFGNVIKNTIKKKSFKIRNQSQHVVSFHLDHTLMNGSGFTIEPEKVKILPNGDPVEFQATFHARNTDIGTASIVLPFSINGGPTISLTMMADITVPELAVSSRDINFGEVLVGQRKTVYISFSNQNSVPCEWTSFPTESLIVEKASAKKKPNAPKKKSPPLYNNDVTLVPSSGILQPGEKSLVMLRFCPSEEKNYNLLLPVKVALNQKPVNILVSGVGIKLSIIFEPEVLNMGPLLPCSEGIEARVQIFNPTNYSLEIYSLEFDHQYAEEEEILKKIDYWGENDTLFLAPRELGQPILEFSTLGNQKSKLEPGSMASAVFSEENTGKSKFEAISASIVVHGPPYSGKTTQAKKICKSFGHVYIKIDDVIESYRAEIDEINRKSALAAQSVETESLQTTTVGGHEELTRTTSAEQYDSFDPHLLTFSEESLIAILRLRLSKDDCQKSGVVIDGIETKHSLSSFTILKAIMKSFPEKKKPMFLHMLLDVQRIHEREIKSLRVAGDKDADIFLYKDMTDEEYDEMDEEEMDLYDSAMIRYKKRMKEIAEKRKLEKRQWEEGLAMERRDKEEKNGKKKLAKKPVDAPLIPPVQQKSDKEKEKGAINLSKVDVKPLKTSTLTVTASGTLSPKPLKKEKADREKEKKDLEKFEPEELSSRLTLLDLIDAFFSDSTYRRFEQYFFSIDSILSWLRDGDKSASGLRPTALPIPLIEKDKKLTLKAKGSAVDLLTIPVNEKSGVDKPFPNLDDISIFEINAVPEENEIYKLIENLIPVVSKTDENISDVLEVIPSPFIEQLYHYPVDRSEVQRNIKYFSLLPQIIPEAEEESVVNESIPAGSPVKPETGKKTRSTAAVKISEEIKVEQEEVEKELYRWIILPHEKKEITIKFNSNEIGKFEQILNFEILGVKGKYSLNCIGLCQYSLINGDVKKIFPKCRKSKEEKMIVHSEFIMNSSTFEFGPLVHNKPKEKYLEKFPENHAVFNFTNPYLNEIKLNFGLKHDIKGETFFFEPQVMDLLPGQTQQLHMWAYPRLALHFEDVLVICVKDNPEPYCYKISCTGAKAEIEIDKKSMSFDKLLLGRKEQRDLKLKNSTLIPIAWKLGQVDSLGEEFSVSPLEGQLEPYQEEIISAHFHAVKPSLVKRVIKLEVCDIEKIGGVQDIPILVTAEAYDIAMDLHFSKGFDGLDFGVLKVFEEGKQPCTLRNKGKYEVGFRFLFETKELSDLFVVTPQQGITQPSDKPYPVQVVFKTNREMTIKEVVGLKCQLFEPTTGEITHNIPVKLSARAVFSKYSILPVRDLNFGALVHGIKGSRQFVIENLGEFDFRFSIYKILQGTTDSRNGKKSRHSKSIRPPSPPPVTKPVNRKDFGNKSDAANFGAFTVFPTSGICPSGQKQQVTVEFHSEFPGAFEENVAVDISDRPVLDTDVIEYRLTGESCIPGINTTDFSSIFEEHSICKRLELFNMQGNVYAEEDRVFYFGSFLAGQQTQVHFKISNPMKVSCDVVISTRPRTRTKSDNELFAFDVEPKRLNIQSHEYKYVAVTFHPTSIQSYAGIFEALVENIGESRNRLLTFELRGEGTLPRVTIEKPTVKNKAGYHHVRFQKSLVGSVQKQNIIVKNEGIIAAKIKAQWVFKDSEDIECNSVNVVHVLKPLESHTFLVTCHPSSIRKFEAELKIKIADNSFEDTTVSLTGEGYLDDLTFDVPTNASGENELIFNDCHIRKTKQLAMNIFNHSADFMRINWPETGEFVVSTTVLHLRPKSSKEVTISFCPKQPCDLIKVPLTCKVTKIQYITHTPEIDWDDKLKSVKWLNTENNNSRGATQNPKKAIESYPEPQFEVIANSASEHVIFVSAFADYCSFECDINEINFKPTLMYQSRIFKFTIKNTGKICLKYSFLFFDDEGQSVEGGTLDCPFSVSNGSGTLEVNEVLTVFMKFSPIDELNYCDYHAVFMVPNLAKDTIPLNITLNGASLRPFCHFELEDNDYIANERSTPEINMSNGAPLILEQGTKVLEFGSCGIKVRNTKRFYIVNPTSIIWEFEWTLVCGNDHRMFKCLTPKGCILPQKKFEIVFEFIPESIDLMESLWKFNILKHNISVPLLLVGKALEPNVFIDKVSINFKSLLVGRNLKETVSLVNNEKIPFSFSFNETSFELAPNGTPVVKFSPMSGTVGGKFIRFENYFLIFDLAMADVPIEITFNPSAEKLFNFNLICNVRKKPTPVTINVKGEGYEIHETLQSEMNDGQTFDFAPGVENILDFGQIQLNEKRIRRITIINSGKFNFDFSWKFFSKTKGIVSVSPEIGTVNKGERIDCEFAFIPTSVVAVKNLKGVCQIMNGRTYPFQVLGSGVRPMLRFSKLIHDFGTQFIYKPGMVVSTTTIKITNEDIREINFDVINPPSNIFEVQKGPFSLLPQSSLDLDISFFPRNSVSYFEKIKFEVNSYSVMELELHGEGTSFKLDLVSPEFRIVNFGAVRVGHSVSRQIKLINRSIIPANFNLGPVATLESLSNRSITLSQNHDIILRPKGILTLDLKFQPLQRISPFCEEIFVETPGHQKQLFVLQGACQGIDIKLENDILPFGAVVQKSYTTRRIQLQNSGDIGAKFRWDVSKFLPEFTISPSEGYISPGMDIPLEITFHPTDINPDIRYESLCCTVEGTQNLYLTLTGMCIAQPQQNETIKFSAPVRQSDTKSIPISNKTSAFWRIHPIVENEYWSGTEVIDIEPGQTKSYDLVFLPLEMTGDGRHEGSVFFPLPDGTGILYKLYGSAEKPLTNGTINREIPCKTAYTEILSLTNWLKKPQRFKVIIEVVKPDPSIILKGLEFFDIPALLTREYKLSFYAYKEGVTNAKVTFKNEQTQEFCYYNLTFKSTQPGVIATYELSTVVRQLISKEIVITNPLVTPVTFNATCSSPDITLPHTFTLQPRAEGNVLIEYLPLLPKDQTARATVTSAELGVYQYDLKLYSTPSGCERSLHFKVGLGGNQVQTFRFLSFAKTKTEYSCKIDNQEFLVEKSVLAPSASIGGTEVCLDVTYEPSKLGDSRTNLIISSPNGGDYICPLDNPFFTIKAAETIGAKKTVQMTIGYKGTAEKEQMGGKGSNVPTSAGGSKNQATGSSSSLKVGKLTVTGGKISWVYYLKT